MRETLQKLASDIEKRVGLLPLVVAAGVIFVVSVIGAVGHSDNPKVEVAPTTTTTSAVPPESTTTGAPTTTLPPRPGIAGYSPVAFTVTPAGKPATSHCALLANTEPLRERGLMQQSDAGGYDGMIFQFDADTNAPFYMANVPISLYVAWFDAAGKFVSSADMPPCKEAVASKCQLFRASGPYRNAIEIPGGTSTLDIGPGATLSVGGGC